MTIGTQSGTRWERLAVSVICVVLASILCSVLVARQSGFGLMTYLQNIFYLGFATFVCSLPGWVIALPAVLLVSNLRGWRFWAMLALGAGIGPLVMFAAALYFQIASPSSGHYAPEARNLVFLATGVSASASALYLLGVRCLPKGDAA